MDYCIPHMLFFKCLILTESYKTLEGVMCGTSLPYQPKDLAARQIARQISTNAQCQSSERRIAPLHSVTEYQLHEVMDSSKARQKVECSTASLVWVVGLTCFTRPSSNASIKCVQCVTCYQQSVVVLQFNMDQVKDKFLERLAIMEKDKKIIRY